MSTGIGVTRRWDPSRWIFPFLLSVGALAIIASALSSGGFRFPAAAAPETGEAGTEHVINVTGTGRVFVTPDLAEVRLGVLAQATTVAEARETGARAMNGALAAIRRAGVADADIQTSTLSLQPLYETKPEGGSPKIVGYELRNGVTITVRDLAGIGAVIDGAVAGGASTVEGISFRVADPTPHERSAREAAVLDARARADTLARTAGTEITGVLSMSESIASPPWTWRDGAPAGMGTPVMPGTTEITVSVSIAFAIR